MLDPQRDRQLLLDVLKPPDGWSIERLIATTYTLDLDALVASAFAIATLPPGEDHQKLDPISALVAIRAAATPVAEDRSGTPRMLIACHAGAVHCPRNVPSFGPWLENLVVPVLPMDPTGIFHPKVWAARWRSPDRSEIQWRVVIGSRNCTFAKHWDLGMALDGRRNDHRRRETRGLAALFRAVPVLARSAHRPMTAEAERALLLDAAEIERFVFSPVGEEEIIPFHLHGSGLEGAGSPILKDLEAPAVDRVLVVSPFLDRTFIRGLAQAVPATGMTILSTHVGFAAAHPVSDPSSCWELRSGGTSVSDSPDDHTDEDETVPANEGLHAKLLLLERGRHATVVIGSANATSAAWGDRLDGLGANVELTAVIGGTISRMGISSLLDSKRGFWRDFIVPHVPAVSPDDIVQRQALARQLRLILALVHRCDLAVTWSEEDNGWQAELAVSVLPPADADVELSIRPLTAKVDSWQPLPRPGHPVRWDSCSVAQVTAWWVLRVSRSTSDGIETLERVLLLIMQGSPTSAREQAALQAVIGNGRELLRFLSLTARSEAGASRGRTDDAISTADEFELSLEDLLRATMNVDGLRFENLDSLVCLLSSKESLDGLPEGFAEVWQTLRLAKQADA